MLNKSAIIFLFLAFAVIISMYISPQLDGFTNISLLPGIFPRSVDQAILDDFPKIGKNETSNNNYSDIWWKYPVLKLASFDQITNNIRYNSNPDNGTCIRADFCGAVYRDEKNHKSNIQNPLGPVEDGPGARVGYYRSEPNELFFSIPTNENILY